MSLPVVVAQALSRAFGSFKAVDDVSFEVTEGEIFGFLGSNGAGKTTTIRMLCGLLEPTGGSATVAGFNVATQGRDIKQRVGYMSQKFSLYSDLAVDENIRFWGAAYGLWGERLARRTAWAIETAGLGEKRRSLVRDLSGGYRQRLALVSALLHEPPVVFLDEPTGGVDPAARRRFWDIIDALVGEGRTVFVTTHSMDEAERCHRVALMHAGRILALDTVGALKRVFAPGTVLEVSCPRCSVAQAVLEALEGVVEVALFGDKLHVTVDDQAAGATLQARLASAGLPDAAVRFVAPSLEDVFIRTIAEATGGPGGHRLEAT